MGGTPPQEDPGDMGDDAPVAVWRTLLEYCGSRLRILTVGAWLATLWSFLAGGWLLGELATHFRPHYSVILALGAGVLAAQRRWRGFSLALAALVANLAFVLPLYWPRGDGASLPGGREMRFLLANVLTSNSDYQRVLDVVRAEDPDIVVLLETNEAWLQAMEPLARTHPHFAGEARWDNFGIAVFSRLPMENLRVVEYGAAEVPSVRGVLQVSGNPVTFIATHPVPPTGEEMFRWRNGQLRALAEATAGVEHCILIGDLNVTPWSPNFRELERVSGLHNARRGFGILPTWPVGLGPLRIPLDHCLVSESIRVIQLRMGEETGGDHLPLLVDLQVP